MFYSIHMHEIFIAGNLFLKVIAGVTLCSAELTKVASYIVKWFKCQLSGWFLTNHFGGCFLNI